MHQSNRSNIRIGKLLEIVSRSNTTRQDIEFLKQYLSVENKALLEKSIGDSKRKYKHNGSLKQRPLRIEPCVITVIDNPQFASDMAKSLSKGSDSLSIAIIDADRLNPRLDFFLRTRRVVKSVYTQLGYERSTGLNLLLDAYHKNCLNYHYSEHIAIKVNGYQGLSYFSGSYLLEDYEYFSSEDYERLLRFLRQSYDIVIISTNKFIYDAYTCFALMQSDFNVVLVKDSLLDAMEYHRYLAFLHKKQNLSINKNFFVTWNADNYLGLSERFIDNLKEGYYLGNIRSSQSRSFMHHKHKISKSHANQYIKLILKLQKKLGKNYELN